MITLSIDGSTKSTGIALFKQKSLQHYQCISSSDCDVYKRIDKMVNRIRQLVNLYQPTDIIMQEVLPQDVKHNQTVYKALIYLQAAIVLQLHKTGHKVNFSTASHWRSTCDIHTGRGVKREELKAAAQLLVKQVYNIQVNDDISDAICLGMAYVKENFKESAF